MFVNMHVQFDNTVLYCIEPPMYVHVCLYMCAKLIMQCCICIKDECLLCMFRCVYNIRVKLLL